MRGCLDMSARPYRTRAATSITLKRNAPPDPGGAFAELSAGCSMTVGQATMVALRSPVPLSEDASPTSNVSSSTSAWCSALTASA